jgi:hypothetical protein
MAFAWEAAEPRYYSEGPRVAAVVGTYIMGNVEVQLKA